MAYDIGARIGLEGEKEYKQALRDIAESQKVMRSEMGLAAAQFEGQEKSVEALTKRHDVLERTLSTQKERVSTLQAALKNAATTFGEADTRTMKWQTQLNDAEAELEKTTHEIKKTDEALQDANNNTVGLGDAVGQLASKFGINLPQGLTTSMNGMGKVNTSSLALAGGIAAVATACAAVIKKLAEMTKKSAEYADEILTTATITGISAQKLQEYTYAAELMDVSVDTITGSQTKLIRAMSDAQGGSEKQIEAFQKLGVEYKNTDGSLRNTEDVFNEVIDALGQKTNATERDALAMDIMGKSAQDLNPLIKAGSEKLREFADEAHNNGNVLNDEELAALGAVDDSFQRLNLTVDGTKNKLAAEFAPYLTEATDKLTKFISNLGQAVKNSGIVDAFGMLLDTFVNIIAPADYLSQDSVPKLTKALDPLARLLAAIASTVEFISAFFDLKGAISNPQAYGERLITASGLGYNSGHKNQYQQIVDDQKIRNWTTSGNYYNGNYYDDSQKNSMYYAMYQDATGDKGTFEAWKQTNGYNASGNHNFAGGLTRLSENGAEAVYLPQGTRIYNAQDTRNLGGDTYYITIDAKSVQEFNDIVKIAKEAKIKARK